MKIATISTLCVIFADARMGLFGFETNEEKEPQRWHHKALDTIDVMDIPDGEVLSGNHIPVPYLANVSIHHRSRSLFETKEENPIDDDGDCKDDDGDCSEFKEEIESDHEVKHKVRSNDDGDWSIGRATWYGGPGGGGPSGDSLYGGSCKFGYDIPSHYTTAWATMGGYDYGLTDKCGQCYEVMCTHGQTRGPNGKLGPWEGCQDVDGRSAVVQVTDSCPCNHGASSNRRWCCGDATHLDLSYAAFDFIALRSRGVVDIKYRQVSCDRISELTYYDADGDGKEKSSTQMEPWEVKNNNKENEQKLKEEEKMQAIAMSKEGGGR